MFCVDIIIYTNSRNDNLENLIDFIKCYQNASRQSMNNMKSFFTSGNKMNPNRVKMIENITGFQKGHLPFKYLGHQIFRGVLK
jgi:hypothetical protein